MATKTYILLPVHNRRDVTQRFIGCLKAQTFRNYHLVLIDDGSTDGTEEMVRSIIGDLTVIRGTGDWWWAGSLQQGYLWLKEQKLADDDTVLIMNDDTEIGKDYLSIALAILRDNPNSLLVSRCYDRQTKEMVDPGTYYMEFSNLTFTRVDGAGEVNCSSTRGLFLRVSDMLAIGGFYPKLLPHYLSDLEYTHRAHKKGFKLLADKKFVLYLDEEATGYHEDAYNTSSRLEIVKRYFSRKSSANPVYWTSFILLCCPWQYKAGNIIRFWKTSLLSLANLVLGSGRREPRDRK
jgi:GT2 family glycosyltransferase